MSVYRCNTQCLQRQHPPFIVHWCVNRDSPKAMMGPKTLVLISHSKQHFQGKHRCANPIIYTCIGHCKFVQWTCTAKHEHLPRPPQESVLIKSKPNQAPQCKIFSLLLQMLHVCAHVCTVWSETPYHHRSYRPCKQDWKLLTWALHFHTWWLRTPCYGQGQWLCQVLRALVLKLQHQRAMKSKTGEHYQ